MPPQIIEVRFQKATLQNTRAITIICSIAKIIVRLFSTPKDHHGFTILVLVDECIYGRQVLGGEGVDLLLELGVKLGVDPRHIAARLAETGYRTCEAIGGGEIEKEDRVTRGDPSLYGAAVIAIYDPLVKGEEIGEASVEFLS